MIIQQERSASLAAKNDGTRFETTLKILKAGKIAFAHRELFAGRYE